MYTSSDVLKKHAALLAFLLVLALVSPFVAAQQSASNPVTATRVGNAWIPLGPDGGDVRSLTYDPQNPDRIFLGTSAGQLYLSTNGGSSWTRFAHFGDGDDYVLDHIIVEPGNSAHMFVGAWSIENDGGDVFRSRDGGRTWNVLNGIHGKSVRALKMAPSDTRILVAGALDGIFRSRDYGNTWERISPLNHEHIKNIESIAIDPRNPDIIYAGTWHLAWKTTDGGRNWHSIKRGVIDDSDVFSLIVDHSNPQVVYLSACSGIYKSENAAELFHKIQGIPFSARRTRVLQQDPVNAAVVYAGTTEGLWKTVDAGKTWKRMTAPNIIVNDVLVDPRHPSHVLIASDRSGVLASNDAAQTFHPSSRGFAHRQVSSVLVDRKDPQTLYIGLINDKEFGGVFVSRNGGSDWRQLSAGLGGRDVFTLRQTETGTLIAGTNSGVYMLANDIWRPMNAIVEKKVFPAPAAKTRAKLKKVAAPRVQLTRSVLSSRVAQLEVAPSKWFAATSSGLLISTDAGQSWHRGNGLGQLEFKSVCASGNLVLASTHTGVVISQDGGDTWSFTQLPRRVRHVQRVAVGPQSSLWIATHQGAFRSSDLGASWTLVSGGLPTGLIRSIYYDQGAGRFLVVTGTGDLFASTDAGETWHRTEVGFSIRNLASARGRLFAATAFDGVIAQPMQQTAPVERAGSFTGSSASN
ncbi:MAG: WD40/YVTN/BNR-like repeat-containing protein [Terriglobales bacterium]